MSSSLDLRAWAQLVRLPNIFTALADICLGALAVGALPASWLPFTFMLLASACLYAGGMVWNDYFDQEQDRRERPFRPLPSGRISPGAAACGGTALLAAGMLLAALAGWSLTGGNGTFAAPVVVAGVLAGAILLYDRWLKRLWAGPIGMGACRFLNVLLGLSLAERLGWPWGVHLALVVGLYIVGVTWFARTEARLSSQRPLAGAAGVMLASLLLALPLPLPLRVESSASSPLFLFLLVALGFLVGLPVVRAIAVPTPPRVQAAVKRSILGLVVLDATLATALAGEVGLLILLLLLPTLYLGRWIYST